MAATANPSIRRVLIYRIGSLGDTVVALPAFHLIAQAFPAAERRLLTSFPPSEKAPASSAILDHTGLVHGFFRYTLRTRSLSELLRLWWGILRWRPQVLVDLSPAVGLSEARRNALFFRLCGIPRLIGVPVTRQMQCCHRHFTPPTQTGIAAGTMLESETSRLLRNLAALGTIDLEDPASWDLKLSPAEHAHAQAALSPLAHIPFVAISLGTKNQANDWGADNWRTLLLRLAALYPTHAIVLCGAAIEAASHDHAASGWRGISSHPALNLCGALTPRESAAVFARASLFLGHDSGPMHLAATVRTPCVAIFSARNPPGIWFPHGLGHRILYRHVDCAACGLQTCILQKKRCILSITVEDVLHQIARILPTEATSIAPIDAERRAQLETLSFEN